MASNKKIFTIVGCGCLAIIVAGIAAVLILGSGLFGLLKGSDPYQESLAKIQAHPEVTATLGTPIEPGFFVLGSINIQNNNGDADITYSISGPNGKGDVHVVGTKQGDIWSYQTMTITLEGGGNTVDLMGNP